MKKIVEELVVLVVVVVSKKVWNIVGTETFFIARVISVAVTNCGILWYNLANQLVIKKICVSAWGFLNICSKILYPTFK